jgi:hypothetical protein
MARLQHDQEYFGRCFVLEKAGPGNDGKGCRHTEAGSQGKASEGS